MFLSCCSEICEGANKEKHFFDIASQDFTAKYILRDEDTQLASLRHYRRMFRAPKAKVKSKRTPAGACRYNIDSTPSYIRVPDVIINMNNTFSSSQLAKKKFVLVLREPAARECSWYQHVARGCVNYMKFRLDKKQNKAGSCIPFLCVSNYYSLL
jgi:hypothetical protein